MKYWILKYTSYCPLCGKEKIYRERKYTPKPENPNERYQVDEHYDYCDV